MAYQPARGRYEYFNTSAKWLGSFGSGQFAGLRAILDSDFAAVLDRQKQVDQIVAAEPKDPNADTWWDKPLISPTSQALFEASKAIAVQPDQKTVLEALFQQAKNAHGAEKGVYMVFSFKQSRLFLAPATNKSPAAKQKTEFTWDLATDSTGRAVMPTDGTQIVIGTLHTHWDDAGREYAGVSNDKDVPSAKTNQFVVYALDRNYLHRANPDGSVHNRLGRNLADVLTPALLIYSKTVK